MILVMVAILRWMVIVSSSSTFLSTHAMTINPPSNTKLLSDNLNNNKSLLTSTQWKVRLDVGLQPGTWMPKRFPGWGESGGRLIVDVDLEFTDQLYPQDVLGGSGTSTLIGPNDQTGIVRVVINNNNNKNDTDNDTDDNTGIDTTPTPTPTPPLTSSSSTFVSEQGLQTVQFMDGGWCIQRPKIPIQNAEGNKVEPSGLLGLWIECRNGAKRNDIVIPPNTKIFCMTGLWDNPGTLLKMEEEYNTILTELQTIEDRTRKTRGTTTVTTTPKKTDNALSNDEETTKTEKTVSSVSPPVSWFQQIQDVRTMFVDSKRYDTLKQRKEELERQSPPKNAVTTQNGAVQLAPTGSLVIKGTNNSTSKNNLLPKWVPSLSFGDEYLILGTFSITPLS